MAIHRRDLSSVSAMKAAAKARKYKLIVAGGAGTATALLLLLTAPLFSQGGSTGGFETTALAPPPDAEDNYAIDHAEPVAPKTGLEAALQTPPGEDTEALQDIDPSARQVGEAQVVKNEDGSVNREVRLFEDGTSETVTFEYASNNKPIRKITENRDGTESYTYYLGNQSPEPAEPSQPEANDALPETADGGEVPTGEPQSTE